MVSNDNVVAVVYLNFENMFDPVPHKRLKAN